jgi:hypothetical protein
MEIKPCPKCCGLLVKKTSRQALSRADVNPVRRMYFLECANCHHQEQGFSAKQVAARWNKRRVKNG